MLTGNPRPQLNISDCAELIPGARPRTPRKNGRPVLTQWGDFESRAKLIHDSDKTDPKEEMFSRAIAAQKEVDLLTELFPSIDKSLIQITYIDTGMNLEKSVELCFGISADVDSVSASPVIIPHPKSPSVIANGKDWPVLTTSDGWQIATSTVVEMRDADEETGRTWKNVLMENSVKFESKHSNAEPTVKQLALDRKDAKRGRSRGTNINNVEDPNIVDYEIYKKIPHKKFAHKRHHRFAKPTSSRPPLLSH